MAQLSKDSEETKEQRKIKKIGVLVVCVAIVLLLALLITGLLLNKINSKWLGLGILSLCIVLEVVSYFLYRSNYSHSKNDASAVWVPKLSGIGVSVNPDTPLVKAIWLIVIIASIALWLYTLLFRATNFLSLDCSGD